MNGDQQELIKGAAAKDTRDAVIYKAYPRHVGRASALRAIRVALNNKGVPFGVLLKRTRAFAASVEHKRKTPEWKFVPYPATWYNREGWEDEMEQPVVTTIQPGQPSRKEQAAMNKRTRDRQDLVRLWWQSMRPEKRIELRGGPYRSEQHEFETAMRAFDTKE